MGLIPTRWPQRDMSSLGWIYRKLSLGGCYFFPGKHSSSWRARAQEAGRGEMRLCPRERADWPIIINKMTWFRLRIHSPPLFLSIFRFWSWFYSNTRFFMFSESKLTWFIWRKIKFFPHFNWRCFTYQTASFRFGNFSRKPAQWRWCAFLYQCTRKCLLWPFTPASTCRRGLCRFFFF